MLRNIIETILGVNGDSGGKVEYGVIIWDGSLKNVQGEVINFGLPITRKESLTFNQIKKNTFLVSPIMDKVKGDKNKYRFDEFKIFFGGHQNFVDLTSGFFSTSVIAVNKLSSLNCKAVIRSMGKHESDEEYEKSGENIKEVLYSKGIQVENHDNSFDLEFAFCEKMPGKTIYFCEAFCYDVGFFSEKGMRKRDNIFMNVVNNLNRGDSLIFMNEVGLTANSILKLEPFFLKFDKFCYFQSKFDKEKFAFVCLQYNPLKPKVNLGLRAYFNRVQKDLGKMSQVKRWIVNEIRSKETKFSSLSLDAREYVNKENLRILNYREMMKYKEAQNMMASFKQLRSKVVTIEYSVESCGFIFNDIRYLGRSYEYATPLKSDNERISRLDFFLNELGDEFSEYHKGDLSSFGNLKGLLVRYDRDLNKRPDIDLFPDLLQSSFEMAEYFKESLEIIMGYNKCRVYDVEEVKNDINLDASVGKDSSFGSTMSEVLNNVTFLNKVRKTVKDIINNEDIIIDSTYNIITKPHEALLNKENKQYEGVLTARNILFQDCLIRCVYTCFTKDYKKVYNFVDKESLKKFWDITASGYTPGELGVVLSKFKTKNMTVDFVKKFDISDMVWITWDVSAWDSCQCFMLWVCSFNFFMLTIEEEFKYMVITFFRDEIFKRAMTREGWLFLMLCYISTGSVLTGFLNSLKNIMCVNLTIKRKIDMSYKNFVRDLGYCSVLGDDGILLFPYCMEKEDFVHYQVGMLMKFVDVQNDVVASRYLSHGYDEDIQFRELYIIFNKLSVMFHTGDHASKYDMAKYISKVYSYCLLYWNIPEVRIATVYILLRLGVLGDSFKVVIEREKDFVFEQVNYFKMLDIVNGFYVRKYEFSSYYQNEKVFFELYLGINIENMRDCIINWYEELTEYHEYLPDIYAYYLEYYK